MVVEVTASTYVAGSSSGLLPTVPAQDGLWLATNLRSDPPVLNNCRLYQVTGPLDGDAVRVAWFAALARQPALRAVLTEYDGELGQHIGSARTDSFQLLDLTGQARTGPDRLAAICAELAGEQFDLATGPLARLHLLRIGHDQHRLVLVAHQAVADDSSLTLLVDELATGYAAALGVPTGPDSPPDLPYQYEEYLRWQQAQRASVRYREAREWWLATLTATPPAGPALAGEPDEAAFAVPPTFTWPAPLSRRVTAFAQADGVASSAILLSAFQLLLARHRNLEQVVVGVPVMLRPRPEWGPLVGPFSNLLAVRADLSGDPAFRDFVSHVDRQLRGALDHAEVPFIEVLSGLRAPRGPQQLPLCQALFDIRRPTAPPRLPGAAVRWTPWSLPPALAELELTLHRSCPSLTGALGYRPDRVSRRAAAGLLAQLRVLLEAGLAAPGLRASQLPLVTTRRRSKVIRQTDRIAATAGDREPIDRLVAAQSARHAPITAIDGSDAAVSYGELDAWAGRLAAGLHALGQIEGAPVAIRMASGPSLVAASLAVLRAGGHLTWLGPGDPGERGRAVLNDLAPTCLLVEGDPADDPLACWFREDRAGRVATVSELATRAPAKPPVRTAASPDQPAYVAYTSGSTGRPKGVRQSHRALAQFARWLAAALCWGPGTRVAQWVSLEHDPSICEVFATVMAGGTVCPVPAQIRTHPERLVEWLTRERISVLQTVPSFARELLAAARERGSGPGLDWLTQLVLMGEALSPELADSVRNTLPWVRLVNIYGPTETVAATWHDVTTTAPGHQIPIGRPIPGRQVLILDRHDRPCPPGIVGEIVIRSPYAVSGYLGQPPGAPEFRPVSGLAKAGDPPLGCYRTGDLGRWRWDGLLEYAGRRDFQVKLAGVRVELAEVEAALAADETVADCAAVPVTEPDGLVSRLVAYVVPRTARGEPANAGRWRAHLRRRFGQSMLRVSFVEIDRIPRNLSGKVDRQRLPDARQAVEPPAAAPRGPIEVALADLWRQLLGSPPRDVEQNFFTAGGDSMQLLKLRALLRKRCGIEASLPECYANPTLAGISAAVAAAVGREVTAAAHVGGVHRSPRRQWGDECDTGQ